LRAVRFVFNVPMPPLRDAGSRLAPGTRKVASATFRRRISGR